MKIGVFDSGIGGQAVATQLNALLPDVEIISVDDRTHVPYGTRTESEIIQLTNSAIQPLLEADCDAIVIACNTATTVAIQHLRDKYPQTNFVGIEPMIKPAAETTKTKHVTVFATPATLKSQRYQNLKEKWATGITVDEPDCSNWASLIESGQAQDVPIESAVNNATANGSDVIVLACTHYHWLKDRAEKAAGGKLTVFEPSDAISRRIKSILNESPTAG